MWNAHGSHQVSAAPLLTSYAKVAPLLKRYESGLYPFAITSRRRTQRDGLAEGTHESPLQRILLGALPGLRKQDPHQGTGGHGDGQLSTLLPQMQERNLGYYCTAQNDANRRNGPITLRVCCPLGNGRLF